VLLPAEPYAAGISVQVDPAVAAIAAARAVIDPHAAR
jgi:hypothetical protein